MSTMVLRLLLFAALVLPASMLAQSSQAETPANTMPPETPARATTPPNTTPLQPPANAKPPEPPANAVPRYSLPEYNPHPDPQATQTQAAPRSGQQTIPQRGQPGDPQSFPKPAVQAPTQPRPQAIPQEIPQSTPQSIPQEIPQSIPQSIPQGAPAGPESAAPPLPAAMATRSKVPSASDYDEVHLKPTVSSEEKAKFDPNSSAAAEAGVDPKLRTHTKPIRVDVDMVLVPVTVTDPSDRPMLGLDRENFVVLDNGERQAIESFSCEDAPVSVGVILDTSGSMAGKIAKAREAIGEFLKTANPEDEFFLISFADKPALVSDFTSSVDELQNRLLYTVAKGRTALLDAIYLGIARMRQAKQRRKALLILSDGGDNRSRYTESEIKSLVKEADVQIYAIGIFDSNPRSEEERYGPVLLSEITEVTGGRTYTVDRPNDLSEVAAKIGLELRNQYVLGYRPSKPGRDGKWRKVRVKLSAPKGLPPLTVYAKMGYYAPNE